MKQRIYVDTSVIGGCLDDEFSKWSVQLFEEFGKAKELLSYLTSLVGRLKGLQKM